MFTSEVARQPWFLDILKEVENGRKQGFDGENWAPHESPEGGKDTIGYGHKILTDIVKISGQEVNLKFDRLSDRDVEKLLIQDVALAEKRAAKQFTDLSPMGDTRWRDLPLQYKTILTEIVYNVGTLQNNKGKWGWPSLTKGMKEDNHKTILSQLMRKFTNKAGKEVALTTRVNKLKRVYKDQLGVAPIPTEERIERLKTALPFFDDLGKAARAKLLAKMVAEDEQLKRERAVKQTEYNTLMEEANERDRAVREGLEEERRTEEEAALQREVQETEEVKPVDEVVPEKPEGTQFFQREDGKVIQVDSIGNIIV